MKQILLIITAFYYFYPLWGQSPCDCTPLVPPTGSIVVVNNPGELNQALQQASGNNGHITILLNAGIYQLSSNLLFISNNMTNLTIRGATGDRDDIVIKGLMFLMLPPAILPWQI